MATLLPWILKRHERRSNLYSAKVNSKIAGSMRWLEHSKLWAIPFECGGLYYLLTKIEGFDFNEQRLDIFQSVKILQNLFYKG